MGIAVAERIPVPFQGEGCGTGELSWGQQSIWAEMERSGKSLAMTGVRELGPEAELKEFVAEFGFYLSRYQAMRTLLRFEPDGRVLQVVKDAGVAGIDIYDAVGRDPAEVAAELVQEHFDTPFDYEREWPMRMALVRRDGRLTHSIVTLAHHMADSTAAMAMFEDLRDRDPVTGEPQRPPGIQPLEQALLQQTPAAQRQNQAALRYWEEQLRVIPPTMFPRSGCWELEYSSPALYRALRAVATRLAVRTGPILYAAFAAALSEVTGVNPVATMITVNNRFRPGLANAAGHMIQHGLCTLDVAGVAFDDLVHTARRRLLAAQKHAYYVQGQLDELIERVGRQRGVGFDLLCLFNDRRALDSPIATVSPDGDATTAHWRQLTSLPQRLMFHVNDSPGALSALVQVDTAYLGRAEVTTLLERMEMLVLDSVEV